VSASDAGSDAMRELVQCVRCGTVIDTELDDADDFEAIELEDGTIGTVCTNCLTGAERQALDEDALATHSGLGPGLRRHLAVEGQATGRAHRRAACPLCDVSRV